MESPQTTMRAVGGELDAVHEARPEKERMAQVGSYTYIGSYNWIRLY